MTVDRNRKRRSLAKRMRILILLATLLPLFAACTPPWRAAEDTIDPSSCLAGLFVTVQTSQGIFVEPTDGYQPVIDELENARCAIDMAVYLLTDERVIVALEAASARGIRVRVILEQYPYGGGGGQQELFDRLTTAGVTVRWSDNEFRFTHAKYFVVDRQVAVIMNQNLTTSAFRSNREFGAVTTDPATTGEAQYLFDRDWEQDPNPIPEGPLIVSPTNSRARFTEMIGQSKRSIDLYAEVINDPGIVASLQDSAERGVRIRLLVNEPEDEETRTIHAELQAAGVNIRVSSDLYIHAKLMIIDGERAVVGSHNFTMTSLDLNREVSIVMEDPVSLRRGELVFASDWLNSEIAESLVESMPWEIQTNT